MGMKKSIKGDAAISKNPNSQGMLSHKAGGSMVAAEIIPMAAMKKNSKRRGRCQAENQSSTTQNAMTNPTRPIAIQPKVASRTKWMRK